MKPSFFLVAALVCVAVPAFAVPVAATVVGPDGKPLPGAKLSSFETPFIYDKPTELREQSGAGGVFRWDWSGDFGDKRAIGEKPFLRVRVSAPGMASQFGVIEGGQTTVQLQPVRAWGGGVFGPDRKPVAGVTVSVKRATPNVADVESGQASYGASIALENPTAVTDANGRWSVPGLPLRGRVTVEVNDPRFVQQRLELPIGEGDAAPIYLKEGGKVTGVVLAPDGKPLAGETVRAGFGAEQQTTTDAQGRFVLAGIEPGEVQIYGGEMPFLAQRDNRLPEYLFGQSLFGQSATGKVEAGKTTDVGEIKATKGVLIRARVVGADTQLPLPDARFRIGYNNPVSVTDAQGNLQTRIVPGGTRALNNPAILVAGYVDYALSPALFNTEKATLDLGTIEMKRGAVITGKVRIEGTEDISRLPGISFSRGGDFSVVNPDKEGKFQSKALQADSYNVSLNQRGDDWEIVSPRRVTVPAAGAPFEPIEIVVKRLTPLLPLIKEARGRLLDADGKAVAGATISARLQMEGGSFTTQTALSDANGDYVFKSNFGDVIGAEVSGGEHPTYLVGGKAEVAVKDGIATISGLTAKKRGAVFAGRVVGKDGKAAAGAWVAVVEARDYAPVQSGADGSFKLVDVPLESFTLLAAQNRDWAQMAVEASAQAAKIELQAASAAPDRAAAVAQLMKIPAQTGLPTSKLFGNWDALGADVTEQFLRRNGPPRPEAVAQFGAEMARRDPALLLRRAPELLDATDGEARENLEAQLALARAQSDDAGLRTDANAWLDEQKAVKREINARGVTQLLQMAAVARALKREDGAQWLDYAAALTAQMGGNSESNIYAWNDALAALDYASVAQFAEGWKVPDEFRLWSYVAPVWARAGDVKSARQALARIQILLAQPEMVQAALEASKQYRVAPSGSLDSVRSAVAGALSTRDAPAAFALADEIKDVFERARAMLKVADGIARADGAGRANGDAKVAEKALRDVIKAPIGNVELFGLAASLGAQINPQLGRELFATAKEKIAASAERRGGFSPPSIGMWAFYYAPIDAAQSRVLIEQEWNWRLPAAIKSKDDDFAQDINALYELVQGMAAVDPNRAAQMQQIADAIETKSYGKVAGQFDLAVIALSTPAQRARMGVDSRF